MYQSLLASSSFFSLLLAIDRDLASKAQAAGCPRCGGPLHRACYPRKPRGGPVGLSRDHRKRFSFCCALEGCRRRVTPASVRFLGRKVYLGAVVLLVSALHCGPTPQRLERLVELFAVSRRTLLRWRRWWREVVPATRWWQAVRGRWSRPVVEGALPGSLLAAFDGIGEPEERVRSALSCLGPLTSGTGLCGGAF